MKTRTWVLAILGGVSLGAAVLVLACLPAAVGEPPKAKPLASWPGVFPEYAGYQRTFEAPEVEAGKPGEYRQAARYEWTGGALKSFRLGVVRGRSVQALFTPEERKTAKEVKIGNQPGLLVEAGEQKVSLLLPLGEDRAVLI